MGRALSDDLRSRVLGAAAEGMSARKAAARFGVGVSSAIRWIARAGIGECSPRRQGRRGGSCLDAHQGFVVAMIVARKDITLDEMVVRLREAEGLHIGRSALNVWLRRHGWTYKKRPDTHWSRSAPMC